MLTIEVHNGSMLPPTTALAGGMHPLFWLALVLTLLGVAMLFRCVARGHAARDLRSLWIGLLLLAASAPVWWWLSSSPPALRATASGQPAVVRSPAAEAAHAVIVRRCYACHAAQANMMHAPWNLNLDQPGAMDALAPRIYRQVVQLRAMPVGNVTNITEDERKVIARWYESLPATQRPATASP